MGKNTANFFLLLFQKGMILIFFFFVGFNMFALHSFMGPIVQYLGQVLIY